MGGGDLFGEFVRRRSGVLELWLVLEVSRMSSDLNLLLMGEETASG